MTNQQRIDAIKELAKGLNADEIYRLGLYFNILTGELDDAEEKSCPVMKDAE